MSSAHQQVTEADTPHDVSDGEYRSVCRFLYDESELLDSRDYQGWLALLSEDMHYLVTAPTVRAVGAAARDCVIVDDKLEALRRRIGQISNPWLTYTENPPSITRRFVCNVLAAPGIHPDEIVVTSKLMLHRSRGLDGETHYYSGKRRDVLRRARSGFLLCQRAVSLDHSVIPSLNISVLL